MRTSSFIVKVWLLALVVGGLVCAASAQPTTSSAFGAGGIEYSLHTGVRSELLGDGGDEPVLVLESRRGDEVLRRVVPGTEGDEVERIAAWFVERESETLFLVWSNQHWLRTRVLLTSYHQERGFGSLIDVSSDSFSAKSDILVSATSDPMTVSGESARRTVVHVLWREENGIGSQVVYAPIVTIDGEAFGRANPVYLIDGGAAPGRVPSFDLIALRPGDHPGSSIAAFAVDESHLATVELHVLPLELTDLAADARGHIIDVGARHCAVGIETLAEKARAHIVDVGARLEKSAVSFLAEELESYLLSLGESACGDDVTSLAEKARGHIIDVGARLSRGAFLKGVATEGLGLLPLTTETSEHYAMVDLVRLIELPVEIGDPTQFYVSGRGDHLILVELGENRLWYRETLGEGWSDRHEVLLVHDGDDEIVLEALRRRLYSTSF